MLFRDIVSVKEAYCCEKCVSFEYDLPCRFDQKILEALIREFRSQEKMININADDELIKANRLYHANSLIRINKDADTKIECKPNTRWLKLCIPKDDLKTKQALDIKLAEWISDTLKIEIEI